MILTNLEPIGAPLVEAWHRAGNEVVGVLATSDARRRFHKKERYRLLAPQWSWKSALKRWGKGAAVEFLDTADPWAGFDELIRVHEPDLLISFLFMQKIPTSVVDRFRLGAVNLHPAILPEIAGSRPIQHMVLQEKHREFGGVTLHEVNDRFDAGAIIATAMFNQAAWSGGNSFQASIAGASSFLVETALPDWCAGRLNSTPQDLRNRQWAGNFTGPVNVTPQWTFGKLVICSGFLGRQPGLVVAGQGGDLQVGPVIRKLGKPSGEPPKSFGRSLEFDVADARVRAGFPNPLERFLSRLQKKIAWLVSQPLPPEIRK